MKILKFIAVPLCLVLLGCSREFGWSGTIVITVTSEVIQGEWVEDMSRRALWSDQKPEKPGRFIVHADGTLEAYDIPNQIVSIDESSNPPSVSGTAKWSFEYMESPRKHQIFRVSWPREMSPPDGLGQVGYFGRESGKLIVWFYVGDSDLYNRVVFVKK